MHEQFDNEIERQSRRLDNRIFQPPSVTCLADIKRLLVELDLMTSLIQSIPLAAELNTTNEKGRVVKYVVKTSTDTQNKRYIIMEGFKLIKMRAELEDNARRSIKPIMVNGKEMYPVVKSLLEARTWVDPLIERWFGGTRSGLRICWSVRDGKYYYDVFEHKLYKVNDDTTKQTDNRTASAS